jgi:hypothetical protein
MDQARAGLSDPRGGSDPAVAQLFDDAVMRDDNHWRKILSEGNRQTNECQRVGGQSKGWLVKRYH